MRSLRSRFTYANVMSTLAAFIALSGATAFAASHLAKNSVGTKQLRNAAVTGAKIKDGAITADKLAAGATSGGGAAPPALALADGSVTSSKLADGSVSAQKLAPGVLPGPQIVHRARTTATLEYPLSGGPAIAYPLEGATYTQPAGEDDLYVASATFHIPASCKSSPSATAELLIDPGSSSFNERLGRAALFESNGGVDKLVTLQFVGGENSHSATSAAPATPVTHTLSIKLNSSSCEGKAGVPSHITAVGAQVDVIGFR